jgi:hypothetical protein
MEKNTRIFLRIENSGSFGKEIVNLFGTILPWENIKISRSSQSSSIIFEDEQKFRRL